MEEDWDHLLFDFDLLTSPPKHDHHSNSFIPPPPPSPPLNRHHHDLNNSNINEEFSVDDIEQLLFNDDDQQLPTGGDCRDDAFLLLHDILLDSPRQGDKSGEEVVDLSSSSSSSSSEDDHHLLPLQQQQQEAAAAAAEEEEEDNNNNNNDPLAKKRKRQLRNRDAAVRSRERKKMHVKDLEMKSRYYEGECRRLGSLLQWYMAENQALRFSLHASGSNASMTKQESAVLLSESLLLGSLLWLIMAAVLPTTLHPKTQSQQLVVQGKSLPSPPRTEEGTKTLSLSLSLSLSLGKRFKASRSRMRPFLQVVITNILPVFSSLLACLPACLSVWIIIRESSI